MSVCVCLCLSVSVSVSVSVCLCQSAYLLLQYLGTAPVTKAAGTGCTDEAVHMIVQQVGHVHQYMLLMQKSYVLVRLKLVL